MTLDIGAPLLAKQTNRKGAGVVTNENPPILKSEITNWRNNNLGGLRERERVFNSYSMCQNQNTLPCGQSDIL